MGTKSKQRTFGRWVANELADVDSSAGFASAHAAPAGLKALLAGAHRWALEIYPVYLASLLAGRFSGAVIDRAPVVSGRRRRGEEDPENISPSAEELRLRSSLRRVAVEVLDSVSSIEYLGVRYLSQGWDKEIGPPADVVPPQGRSAAARAWNLFLLTRALVRMFYEGEADRYSTAERWLYTGYALLDALGGRPAWLIPEDEREQLVAGFARKDRGLLRLMLEQMARAAGEHGLGPLPLLAAAVTSGERGAEARPDAAEVTGVRRARHAPSVEQIDRMARLLLDDARRPPRRRNSSAPLDVLLYLDLLAVGARRSEALKAGTHDVIALDGAVAGADLLVRGVKTPAAYRLVPLDLHPNRGSAERIVDAARVASENRVGLNLIQSMSRHWYARRRGPKRDWGLPQFAFSSLDHALKKLGERVGIESLSPHDLRRASITACLLAGVPPELIAKYHGHEDLPTTFEHYVFGLSAVQARDLGSFLSREENQVWVAITDAVQLLGATKVAVYKRYSPKNRRVKVIDSADAPGFVIQRSGRPRYVNAVDLADHVRRKAAPSSSSVALKPAARR
jgi:integrase